jgi:hypothetical protein
MSDRELTESALPGEDGAARPAPEKKSPRHATPAPADSGLPVPRFIRPIERAPKGLVRVKIRCTNVPDTPTEYVLAKTPKEALTLYQKMHLGRVDLGGTEPQYAATVLPD